MQVDKSYVILYINKIKEFHVKKIMLLLLAVSFNCLASIGMIGASGAVGAGTNIVIRSSISAALVESELLNSRSIGDTNPDFIMSFMIMMSQGDADGSNDGYDAGYD